MNQDRHAVGVVGAGTMGAGIAQIFALAGYPVVLLDAEATFVDRGVERISTNLAKAVGRGTLSQADADAALDRIHGDVRYSALSDCAIVIEAVPESLAIKQPVLAGIAEQVADTAIIASNTSSLAIRDLATYVSTPERVIGMHFFNPVPQMALVEVVASDITSPDVVDTVIAYAEAVGKTPVRSDDQPGFIVNRVLIPMINEAVQALQDGVGSAEDIDRAMKLGAGQPMGPLSLADLIGNDVVLSIMDVLKVSLGEKYAPATLLQEMVTGGKLGRKSGRGFFEYEERAR